MSFGGVRGTHIRQPHYRKKLICRLWITDGKDLNLDGKDFAVRRQTANSDGKDKSAKNTLPSAKSASPSAL